MSNPHALSRNAMLQHIQEGRSILYNNQILSRVEQVPSEAELAKGDPEAEKLARANLAQRKADLAAESALLPDEPDEDEDEDSPAKKRGPGRPPGKH